MFGSTVPMRKSAALVIQFMNSSLNFVKSTAPENGTMWIAPSEVGYKTAVRTVNSGECLLPSVHL